MVSPDARTEANDAPHARSTQKRRWSDLSTRARSAIVVAGAAEVVVTTLAVRDLRQRPRHAVRGPKLLWLVSFVVQPVGPLGYFWLGRRRDPS